MLIDDPNHIDGSQIGETNGWGLCTFISADVISTGSISDIEALDDAFLKHWGDKKDLLYYYTKFGNFTG